MVSDDELADLAVELESMGDTQDLNLVIEELEARGYFNKFREEPATKTEVPMIESFMDKMGKFEGVDPHEDVGGVKTQPFGVVNTMGVAKEEGEDDRTFAVRVAEEHKAKLSKEVRGFDSQPQAVQEVLMSVSWNTGKVFPKMKKAVEEGDYKEAGRQLLDVVTQNKGPNIPPNERWVVPGLLKRRAAEYNILAEEFGFNKITDYDTQQKKGGVLIMYYSDDVIIFSDFIEDKVNKRTVVPKEGRTGKVSIK